ncbi:MoaD/ThiS family protein [Portibacter marinus]|uniref:MoaD/ThiS family protein n=1 Tax=Portibacter marinus TaxID=2898660 RepID=UPI001F38F9D0|nr:MoaD/ThiS family protein [Portibacter marinus]
MIKVHFTSALSRFFPNLKTIEVDASTIPEVLESVEIQYPGMKSFLLDDSGNLRKHVNIFIGEEMGNLHSEITPGDDLFVFQALSGG